MVTRFENGFKEQIGEREFRTTLSPKPVNYFSGGAWLPIADVLGATGDPGRPIGVSEFMDFRIADLLAGQSPVIHIGRGADFVRITPLGTNVVSQQAPVGNAIRFPNAWNGADLELLIGGHILRKNIHLSAGHPSLFEFRIDSHAGFDPQTLAFGKFKIQPPIIQKAGEMDVFLDWIVSQQGGKTVLGVALPTGDWSGWVLDPTTTLQPGAAGLDAGGRDTAATNNFGTAASFYLGGTGGIGDANRIYIKFDVSSIPSGDTVSSATFSLFEVNASGTGTWAVKLQRMLRDWVELESTWNIWKTANNWTAAGAGSDGNDRSATITASVTLDGTSAGAFIDWTDAQLDSDVQNFVDGGLSNFGWLVHAPDAEGGVSKFNQFNLSDNATASERPKLVVVHTGAAGSPWNAYAQQ